MSHASAPGKVVLSGAYAVLLGTPAIVTAVDRRAFADASRNADFTTAEVASAIELGFLECAPAFSASSQREAGRKLGLGSSAAVLVASLLAANPSLSQDQLFTRALRAHRKAQGGGSGIDVAASVYGGTLSYHLDATGSPSVQALTLPRDLFVEVWSSPVEAKTSALIASVEAARSGSPEAHRAIFDDLDEFGREALAAARSNDAEGFTQALQGQAEGLSRLGLLAGVPICTNAVRSLDRVAREQNSVVLPAGAGGGDVCVYVGTTPPGESLTSLLREHSHQRLTLTLEAAGASRSGL